MSPVVLVGLPTWRNGCAIVRLAAAGVLLAGSARAAPSSLLGASEPSACRAAIYTAEAQARTPKGLLLAIGLVESGRLDTQTGRMEPWPWAVNVAGAGYMPATEADAIALVRSAQADGVRSIDVGCMQVNLQQHPDAFVSLEDAFEPRINAHYAAAFLTRLREQTGTWLDAGAAYHSQTPDIALPYRQRLVAMWPGAPHEDVPAGAGSGTPDIEAANRLPAMRVRLAELRADQDALKLHGLLAPPIRSALNPSEPGLGNRQARSARAGKVRSALAAS